MRVAAAHSASDAGFDPRQLGSALHLWYRADVATLVNGAVSSWTDLSGNGRHATQSTAAARPTWRSEAHALAIGGRPVLDCDGADDYLDMPTGVFDALTAADIYVVCRLDADPPPGADQSGPVFEAKDTSIAIDAYPWFADGIVYSALGSTTRQTTVNATLSLATAHVYNVSTAANDWRMRLSGDQRWRLPTNVVGWGTGEIPQLGRGRFSFYFDGQIAEVIVYSRVLTRAERSRLHQYVTSRYGISIADESSAIIGAKPLAWIRADRDVTLNGATVAQVNDQSDNSRHATQGTAARQPTYIYADADFNGGPCFSFDGGDRLDFASMTLGAQTIFFVGRLTAAGYLLVHNVDALGGGYMWGTTGASIALSDGATWSSKDVTANWAVTAAVKSHVWRHGGTHATHTLRTNGADVSLTDVNTTDQPATRAGALYLGANQTPASGMAGKVAELIVYDRALSTTEIEAIEAVLRARWGHY